MPVLRGRESGMLRDLVATAARGRGAVAVVVGEPGIGKTRLLAETADRARAAGCLTMRASADELLADRPFGMLVDALGLRRHGHDPETAEIAAMLEPGYRAQPELEFVIIDRIVDLVERRATSTPLVLTLDDLQWSDSSSLRVLHRLATLAASTPLLLVLSHRPAPRPVDLDRLLRHLDTRDVTHLPLGPLAPVEAYALATELLGAPLGERLQRYVDGAGGNPLFIEELVAALRASGPLGSAGELVEAPDPLPRSVTETIMARIGWLSEETLDLLRTATVLGTPFRLADLALVTGRDVPALLELLGDAIALGVLTEQGEAFAFRHDLVREAIYRAMSAPVRAGLHTHVGQVLAGAGRDPLTVAYHLSRGVARDDPAALDWLSRAAAAVRPHAPATAVDLLDQAIAMASPGTPRHTELRLAQLEARVDAGALPAAVALGERLLAEHLPRPYAARARHALAEARMWQARPAEAAEQVGLLIADVEDPEASVDRLRLVAWLAFLRSLTDPDSADSLVDKALASAGATEATFFAKAADANRLLRRGHLSRAADQAAAACAILRAQYDQGERVRLLPPVQHLYHADRFDEVAELLNHPIWADRARHQPLRHFTLANIHYLRGEWDDALVAAATSATLARELDSPVDAGATRVQCLVSLARGQLDDAIAAAGNPPPPVLAALLAYAQGHPDQARAALPGVWEWLRASPVGPDVARYAMWPILLPLCLAVDDRDRAEEVGQVVVAVAERAGVGSATAAGMHARGLLDDNPDPLLAAVEAYRQTPRLVDRIACQEAAGLALARRGHRDDAAAHLRAAAEAYEAMRAARHLARVEAGLRQIGVPRGRRRPRTQPTTGWDSLTPTERSVAALVADGLVYREVGERLFISRRTVETHVANMFAKLDIASRAELAELVRRHTADLTAQ
jgi:DNA-binding CsgD family transcriptional regulator